MIGTGPQLTRKAEKFQERAGYEPQALPRECQLCRCGEERKVFVLPVLDGPYKTESGWTTRSFYQCSNCGYLTAHPFDADRYARYYAGLADSYHGNHDRENSRYSLVFEKLQTIRIRSILDWGCGTGTFLSYFADEVEKCGVEVCEAAASRARGSRIRIVTPEEIEQGWMDHSLDAVTAIDVVEHIPNLNEFRDLIARILRPGGTFAILTGNLDSPVAKFLGQYWYYIHYGEHVSFLTERAARQWLQVYFENITILRTTHHKSAFLASLKAFPIFSIACVMEKVGLAKRLRLSAKLCSDSDHMLILAQRKAE